MKKKLFLNCILFLFANVFTLNAQIVLNNGCIINVFNNGGTVANKVYLVLNNVPATPIVNTATTAPVGGIMLETEFSILQYNLNASTTAITVPYWSYKSESFPLKVNAITAGVVSAGTGNIQFSSKTPYSTSSNLTASLASTSRNTGWDNLNYIPSVVNNMTGVNNPTGDNSANVIDRFWIINPVNYTTKPAVTLNFTYIAAEAATNGGNTITEANLMAQQFDDGAHSWGGYGPTGSINTIAKTVSSVVVPSNYFFRSWTLSDNSNPLPIELLQFTGTCTNGMVHLNWATAVEINSSYFTIEKSTNGIDFTFLAKVNAAQNSTTTLQYNYTCNANAEDSTTYYRLSETDLNGSSKIYSIIDVNGCQNQAGDNVNLFGVNDKVKLDLFATNAQPFTITAYAGNGQLVFTQQLSANKGINYYELNTILSPGIYLFIVQTPNLVTTKKILIY